MAMKTDTLDRTLRSAARATMFAETARAIGLGSGTLLLAVLVAVGVDVVFSLRPWGLMAVDAVVAALALSAIIYTAWVVYRNLYDHRRIARLVEQRLGIADSRLINAVDLAGQPARAFSKELLARSVSEGDELAGRISPLRVVDGRRLGRAVLAVLLAMVAMLAAYLWAPGMFRAVVPRYLHPSRDLAPFTLVRFEVSVLPGRVYVGRPATIQARLTGQNLPDQANVVFLDPAGAKSLPMVRDERGAFILQMDRADQSRQFYIDTPTGRSDVYPLTVLPVPAFQRVTIRYAFPEYTRWPATSSMLDASGIRAIEGTAVTVTIKSNLPLKSGQIVLTPVERAGGPPADSPPAVSSKPAGAHTEPLRVVMQPTPEDATTVSGMFPLSFTGRYAMSIVGQDDLASNETREGALTCTPDALPTVQFLEPDVEVMAPENWKVHVAIAARDDVAVGRIQLYRGVNGWTPVACELPMQSSGPTYAVASDDFDLGALGAKGGDVIAYFATAQDNCPDVRHIGETPMYVIRVVSQEDYTSFARSKYRMEQVLAELADFQRSTEDLKTRRDELLQEYQKLQEKIQAADGRVTEEDRKKLDQIDAKHKQYAELSRELAKKMQQRAEQPKIYDFEETYAQTLTGTADKLDQQGEGSEKLAESLDAQRKRQPENREEPAYIAQARKQLERDREAMEPSQKEMELTDEELDRLRKADEMVSQSEQIVSIARRQRDLADRLGQFRNKERLSATEQIRARRMAGEQAQLEKELTDTLDQLERQAQAGEDELPTMSASARKMIEDIRQLDVSQDQSDASRLAEAGDGRYAHRSADSAASKLESLLQEDNPEGMMGAGATDFDKALKLRKQAVANSLRQLSQGRGLPGNGGEGGGMSGSMARVAVVGPHNGGGPDSKAVQGQDESASGGGKGAGDQDNPAGAEKINPNTDAKRSVGAGGTPGVPARYRDLAEAYFRRLADENK